MKHNLQMVRVACVEVEVFECALVFASLTWCQVITADLYRSGRAVTQFVQ